MYAQRYGVCFVFALALIAIPGISFSAESAQSKDKISVYITQAEKVTVPMVVSAVGKLDAFRSVDLSFGISGRHLKAILKQEGSRVQKGDIIAQVDEETDRIKLRADKASYDLALATYNRLKTLEKIGAVSVSDLDQASANVTSAEATYEKQQNILEQTKLIAPFDGVLTSYRLNIGSFVNEGETIVSLIQEAPLYAEYSLNSILDNKINLDQKVTVISQSVPDKVFIGHLVYKSPHVSPNTGTITLRAEIPNNNYLLSPGLTVSIRHTINPNRTLLMVPSIAILTDVNGSYVYTVNLQNSQVKKVYVKVGEISGNLSAIQSGILKGTNIIYAGQEKILNPAIPVAIIKNITLEKFITSNKKKYKTQTHTSQEENSPQS